MQNCLFDYGNGFMKYSSDYLFELVLVDLVIYFLFSYLAVCNDIQSTLRMDTI